MQVFIRTTTSFCLDVDENDTVLTLKEKIFDHEGLSVDIQKLIYNGKILQNCIQLKQYKINDLCTIDLKTLIIEPKWTEIIINFDKSPELIYCVDVEKRDKAQIFLEINEKAMFHVIFSILKLNDIKHAIKIETKSNYNISHNTRINETNQNVFMLELMHNELTFNQKLLIVHKISSGISINRVKSPQILINSIKQIPYCRWFNQLMVIEKEMHSNIKYFDQFPDVIQLTKQCQNGSKLIVSTKEHIKHFLILFSLKITKNVNDNYYNKKIKNDFEAKLLQIKAAEMKIANIDIKLNEIRTEWEDIKNRATKLLWAQQCKLEQKVFNWTHPQLADWFTYNFRGQSGLHQAQVISKLNKELILKIHLTGNKIHEITDSVLCIVGVTDVYDRHYILSQIKSLLNVNGYYIKKTNISSLCFGCAFNEVNTVNLPCGHMVYCKECSVKSLKNNCKCAICRVFIVNVITIYRSGNNNNNDDDDDKTDTDTEDIINTVINARGTVPMTKYYANYLKYLRQNILNMNKEQIKKEITDSFLNIVGIKNVKEREFILNKINGNDDNKVNDKQYCCACSVNQINTVIDPCGHMVYCKECSIKSLKATKFCAICRKDVRAIPVVYPSGFK